MKINDIIRSYHSFLILEKALSDNTVEAYMSDVDKLLSFARSAKLKVESLKYADLSDFVKAQVECGVSVSTVVRVVSSVKSFYRYLFFDGIIKEDPSVLLESPRVGKHLPDVLTVEEIDAIIASVDLSKPEGQRNKAIMETLYSCGLRVSELVSLQLTDIFRNEGFIKVVGKGNKERLVPISQPALDQIDEYCANGRAGLKVKAGFENIVFLNRRGAQLTRVMIFTIIKMAVKAAGIKKNVSPHTFRHSFATHLLEHGANLRVIQDMLGHSSITTTEVYAHLNSQMLKEAVEKFHPRAQEV